MRPPAFAGQGSGACHARSVGIARPARIDARLSTFGPRSSSLPLDRELRCPLSRLLAPALRPLSTSEPLSQPYRRLLASCSAGSVSGSAPRTPNAGEHNTTLARWKRWALVPGAAGRLGHHGAGNAKLLVEAGQRWPGRQAQGGSQLRAGRGSKKPRSCEGGLRSFRAPRACEPGPGAPRPRGAPALVRAGPLRWRRGAGPAPALRWPCAGAGQAQPERDSAGRWGQARVGAGEAGVRLSETGIAGLVCKHFNHSCNNGVDRDG